MFQCKDYIVVPSRIAEEFQPCSQCPVEWLSSRKIYEYIIYYNYAYYNYGHAMHAALLLIIT